MLRVVGTMHNLDISIMLAKWLIRYRPHWPNNAAAQQAEQAD